MECIFCKIIRGEAHSEIFYQDEDVIVFQDINPKAPIHLLICPKQHYADFISAPPDVLSMLNESVKQVREQLGDDAADFRVQINNGPGAGQLVFHLHYHFMAWK
jgi:histidine triad (HIT) family protein